MPSFLLNNPVDRAGMSLRDSLFLPKGKEKQVSEAHVIPAVKDYSLERKQPSDIQTFISLKENVWSEVCCLSFFKEECFLSKQKIDPSVRKERINTLGYNQSSVETSSL